GRRRGGGGPLASAGAAPRDPAAASLARAAAYRLRSPLARDRDAFRAFAPKDVSPLRARASPAPAASRGEASEGGRSPPPSYLARVAVLLLAVALDLALGDPPNRWHPVAWIGALIAGGRRLAERVSPRLLTTHGAPLLVVVVVVTLAGSLAAPGGGRPRPRPRGRLVAARLPNAPVP